MECNRDDAIRSKEIAERKFNENDITGAKKFALKAKTLFDSLEGIDNMISALNIHIRAQTKIEGENDVYGILDISASDDDDKIKKQYRKLALQTHPDKNKFSGAESAFKLIQDAWDVLSDKDKKRSYDQKRFGCSSRVYQNGFEENANATPGSTMSSMNGFFWQNSGPANRHPSYAPDTFWTYCGSCQMSFQYSREYVDRNLPCSLCQTEFVAVETPPPTAPVYYNVTNLMGPSSNMDDPQGTGVPYGSNQNFDPMLQPVFGSVGGAHASGYPVQRTYEPAGKEEVAEVNVARREEATKRKHEQASSSLGSSSSAAKVVHRRKAVAKEMEAEKRRCINNKNKVSGQKNNTNKVVGKSTSSAADGDSGPQKHPAKRKSASSIGTSGTKRCKMPSDHNSGNAKTSFGKVFLQLEPEITGLKMEKTKLQIRDKLEEFKSRRANVENKGNVHVSLEKKEKTWKWKKPATRIVYTRRNRKEHRKEPGVDAVGAGSSHQHLNGKYSCLDQVPSSDEASCVMPVPEANFYTFGDHPETSFQNGQIWAAYDEEDGMPRYYALIQKVLSRHPFKVRLAFLKAKDCSEFVTSNWISYGYSKTCGDFIVGAPKNTDQLNTFSHVVTWEKGSGGIIRIFPRKGDIWALYQNWSPEWNTCTPDDTIYKYDLVQVLDSYNPSAGISVMPIVKVPGFVSVFRPLLDPTKSRTIPKEEMLRFSHQVPFHVLSGEEAKNSPKGCYELDPGSTPKELLQVVPQSDGV
uniref:J domain-containing protein n=1 Tax=Oryza punctata TaxID=4537 RepID=A0A0E0JSY7_ORYPU